MAINLNIRFKGVESSQSLKNYLNERCGKFEKYISGNTVVSVGIKKEKERQIAELKFHHKGNDYFAKETTENIYSSIDLVVDKIKRQLSKVKDKKADYSTEI